MENIVIEKINEKDVELSILTEKTHNIHILNENILKEDLKKENYIYLVAKNNGNILGYIGISFVLDSADIISVVVSKEHTNKGIASLLLENVFKVCKEKNITNIILEVRKSNIPAQKLYEKFGFSNISIRKNYYDGIEDAYIYKKEL